MLKFNTYVDFANMYGGYLGHLTLEDLNYFYNTIHINDLLSLDTFKNFLFKLKNININIDLYPSNPNMLSRLIGSNVETIYGINNSNITQILSELGLQKNFFTKVMVIDRVIQIKKAISEKIQKQISSSASQLPHTPPLLPTLPTLPILASTLAKAQTQEKLQKEDNSLLQKYIKLQLKIKQEISTLNQVHEANKKLQKENEKLQNGNGKLAQYKNTLQQQTKDIEQSISKYRIDLENTIKQQLQIQTTNQLKQDLEQAKRTINEANNKLAKCVKVGTFTDMTEDQKLREFTINSMDI